MKCTVAELQFVAKKVWLENNMVCIKLIDQREVRFPVYLNEKLRHATEKQLENVELICGGTGLHWPALDEDLSVMGIMEGKFGKV